MKTRVITIGLLALGLCAVALWLKSGFPASVPTSGHASHGHPPNALATTTSPYLLQHAHNPVDWYPWGPEALALAKKNDLPIFLSIGYSACYWCHVMEREVFSDTAIARQMNEGFINIKVDREERPDLDAIYMTATQIITQGGGWPNSVFLTPDLKPFFAGTYFPPEDRFGRPGFPRLLTSIAEAWTTRRSEIEAQADRITATIKRVQEGGTTPGEIDEKVVEDAIQALRDGYDPAHGGFTPAPKFPPDNALHLILHRLDTTKDPDLLEMVRTTLDAMANGGIYDHLEGGFHRYATDTQWRIPHFEKMLYNQALIAGAYLRAFETTSETIYADAVRGTLSFVASRLTGPHGGFYTALDAETNAVEGLTYLWRETDLRESLGVQADRFFEWYALEPMPEETLGGALYSLRGSVPPPEIQTMLSRLLEERSKRQQPRLDDKTIAGWNGLMVAAYADAYRIFGEESYLAAATSAWEHLLGRQTRPDGRLFRIYRRGSATGNAYQDDYAFVIRGLLALNRATDDNHFLEHAIRLQSMQDLLFWDHVGGAYFYSETDELLARQKSTHDSAIPSGNAEAVHNLLTLGQVTGNHAYTERAGTVLRTYANGMRKNPAGYQRMIHGLARYLESKPSTIPITHSGQVVTVSGTTRRHSDDAPDSLTVRVEIADGWHINAFDIADSALVRTELIAVAAPAKILTTVYPRAERLVAAFSTDTVSVYSGRISIAATVRAPDSLSSQFAIRLQACDSTRCLLPTTIPVTLEEGE